MEIQVQENSPAFAGENEFIDELVRLSRLSGSDMPIALLAVAYEGTKVRIVIRCETEEEVISIMEFLDAHGFIDLLTEADEVDEVIGRTAAENVRAVIGRTWDALYVRRH